MMINKTENCSFFYLQPNNILELKIVYSTILKNHNNSLHNVLIFYYGFGFKTKDSHNLNLIPLGEKTCFNFYTLYNIFSQHTPAKSSIVIFSNLIASYSTSTYTYFRENLNQSAYDISNYQLNIYNINNNNKTDYKKSQLLHTIINENLFFRNLNLNKLQLQITRKFNGQTIDNLSYLCTMYSVGNCYPINMKFF